MSKSKKKVSKKKKETLEERINKSGLTYNESVNLMIQVANKYQGSRADFTLIEKALDTLIRRMDNGKES